MKKVEAKGLYKAYWRYFKYIIEHKYYVFIECWKVGLYLHAFIHDLSKFLPSEFFPYAWNFYGPNYACIDGYFKVAWLHHYHRNKHHWNYWVKSDGTPMSMPKKYIVQMIIDWKAMGRKFNNTAQSFYKDKKDTMVLHEMTKWNIEDLLNIKGNNNE